MEFEENKEKFRRKITRNLKEKHREFFTRDKTVFVTLGRQFFNEKTITLEYEFIRILLFNKKLIILQ